RPAGRPAGAPAAPCRAVRGTSPPARPYRPPCHERRRTGVSHARHRRMTMLRRSAAPAAAFVMVLAVGGARAAGTAPPAPPAGVAASATAAEPAFTAQQADAAAEEIARLIAANYVFPEKRPAIARAVRDGIAAHRYAADDPREAAQRIT